METETKRLLVDLGIDPETVEWISVKDYLEVPEDELEELHAAYRIVTFYGTDQDKIFIVPMEKRVRGV